MEQFKLKKWMPVLLMVVLLAAQTHQNPAKTKMEEKQAKKEEKAQQKEEKMEQKANDKAEKLEQRAAAKEEKLEQKAQAAELRLTKEQCSAAVAQCTLISPHNPEYSHSTGQPVLNNPKTKAKKTSSQYRAILNRLKNDIIRLINAVIVEPELASLPSVCVDLNDEATGSSPDQGTPTAGPYQGPKTTATPAGNSGSGSNSATTTQQSGGSTGFATSKPGGPNSFAPSTIPPSTTTLPPLCTVSEWSEWSKLIGFGQQDRKRTVVQPGVDCPYSLSEWRQVSPPTQPSTADGNSKLENDFEKIDVVGDNFGETFIHPSGGKPRDILLILDSSGSISDADFEIMKQGVKVLIDSLCGGFGPNATNNRLSIIQFSTDRVGVHAFNHEQESGTLKSVVDTLQPMYGVTCTGSALDLAYTAFSGKYGARDYALHDTLLITDGQSNCGEDLVSASTELQQRSNVYALGIGIGNNPYAAREIQSVVSNQDPRHLFSLANFKDFQAMVQRVQSRVTPDKCQAIDV